MKSVLPIISSNGSLSVGATVTAGSRHSGPRHIPPAQLQQHRLIKHHGIFLPKDKKKRPTLVPKTFFSLQEIVVRTDGKPKESITLPGSTVICQHVSLSQQITVCLVVTPVRSQLKKLHKNRTGSIYCKRR